MDVTAAKTVHSVIVFYDEKNKESAQYLLEKIDFRDDFVIKKYLTDFGGGKILFYCLNTLNHTFEINFLHFHRLYERTHGLD